MAFDRETRNALAKMTTECRRLITADVLQQLQSRFGMYPDGNILPVSELTHLTETEFANAEALRNLYDHIYAGTAGKKEERIETAYAGLVFEISFTHLNRLAALRLCEERGIIQESIRKGYDSAGFKVFDRPAEGALGDRYQTYRIFLELMFDELAVDLGMLFDRTGPHSAVFPSEHCLNQALEILNSTEISQVWTDDETIGWVYQYFNPPEERKAMREASQAPRNTRELAVRNQFFTPRYVVKFLTDNTLGRIWYEMRKGDTALKDECRYLVRRPNEVFLSEGEMAPAEYEGGTNLSQEELLKQKVHIEHRPKKDPRDLKVLDPACGSGHFLLYAFDLLERIYEEAWGDHESPKFENTGRTLQEDFKTLDHLRRESPKLIMEYNLHGIDIDSRAAQIAVLALWLRAQKTWKNLGIKAAERPRVAKSNIVTAEPMPGEEDMKQEFTASLKPLVLGQLVDAVFDKMKLAGEVGSLLKIEEEIKGLVSEAKEQWLKDPKPDQQLLFPRMDEHKPTQQKFHYDFKGITDDGFWEKAEDRILDALRKYSEETETNCAVIRRLFTDDAARGFAFIKLCLKLYDVVLMNPPFGEAIPLSKNYLFSRYDKAKYDMATMFTEQAYSLIFHNGLVGALANRVIFYGKMTQKWRESLFIKDGHLSLLTDLGLGVLDDAMVEAVAFIFSRKHSKLTSVFLKSTSHDYDLNIQIPSLNKDSAYKDNYIVNISDFIKIPDSPFAYWISKEWFSPFKSMKRLKELGVVVKQGMSSSDNFRFVRLWWETAPIGKKWYPYCKGGGFGPQWHYNDVVVNWENDGNEIKLHSSSIYGTSAKQITNTQYYKKRGITYPASRVEFSPRVLPAGCVMGNSGPIVCFDKTPKDDVDKFTKLLAIMSSSSFRALLNLTTSAHGAGKSYREQAVAEMPVPDLDTVSSKITNQVYEIIDLLRMIESCSEICKQFIFLLGKSALKDLITTVREKRDLLDDKVSQIYGFSGPEYILSESGFDDCVEHLTDFDIGAISYSVGAAFGRWDLRIALDSSLAPKLPDPFDSIPVCPPGILFSPNGLPADSGHIVSEDWLRARPDANTLPLESAVKIPTIPDSNYPLRISWNGILVDDPGFNGAQPHREDIVRRVREVLDLLWKDKAHEIEQEACDILGVSDLREYFRKPSGFFQDHLKRYSKSRRKAPIYWPFSTASGGYTLWIYYHRLSDQILYTAVNKYVDPKISDIDRSLKLIEQNLDKASGQIAAKMRDQLNQGRSFLNELQEFKEELMRIAALPYKPNLNDGVIINAAPFYRLFRLRSWAKDTEACWKKLKKGDYDWAHMAYTIWPDQVRKKCEKDKSIAIAHGLEELYVEIEKPEKKQKKRKSA